MTLAGGRAICSLASAHQVGGGLRSARVVAVGKEYWCLGVAGRLDSLDRLAQLRAFGLN